MIQIDYNDLISNNIELKSLSDNIIEIGNIMVKDIIEENKEANVPSVFSFDNGIVYQMPNGKLVKCSPFDDLTL